MIDQAANLRRLAYSQVQRDLQNSSHPGSQIIGISSAKGGVGKSTLSLYLSYFLARSGARVLLIDANLTSPSLHVMIGNDSLYSLHHFVSEGNFFRKPDFQPLYKQLYFLPNTEHEQYSEELRNDLPEFLKNLQAARSAFDFIILDTETGLNQWNVSLLLSTDNNLVLSFSDPTAIIDTYLYFKTLYEYTELEKFSVIFNQILEDKYGMQAIEKLNLALSNFLNVSVELAVNLPLDLHLKKSIQNQILPWHNSCNTIVCQRLKKLTENMKHRISQQIASKLEQTQP